MKLIENAADLEQLCRDLHVFDRLAIDTEFHAEHRYIPKLLLIQIAATPDQVWLIDPLKVDPRPLKEVLQPRRLIFHGGKQDLRLLHHTIGLVPGNVLDVQQASGLLGTHYPARLSAILSWHLNKSINKEAGLSNWSQRPLQPEQLMYAAEDAKVLLKLAPVLEEKLAEQGRMDWALDLGKELVRSACEPHQSAVTDWMNWDIATRLTPLEQQILDALFCWREETARRKNRQVHTILSGRIALDLARRRPHSTAEILKNRRIHPGLVKHNGAAILSIIDKAESNPTQKPLLTREEKDMVQLIQWWIQVLSPTVGVAPRLLVPDSLALEIARNGHRALLGWRNDLLSAHLQSFLSGKIGITVQDGKPRLAPFLMHNSRGI